MICYDCKNETDDYVVEPRCTGGGDVTLNAAYSYDDQPVCANRRTCMDNKARAMRYFIHCFTCPVCAETVRATRETQQEALTTHLNAHGKDRLVTTLLRKCF